MKLRITASLVLAAALTSSGCRMCCPSYDYCGPTNPGESNSECCGMVRQGTILSGGPAYVEGETYVEEATMPNVPQVTPQTAPPVDMPVPKQSSASPHRRVR